MPSPALTASTWKSTTDCPRREATLCGSRSAALELESCTSAAAELSPGFRLIRQIPRDPAVSDFGVHEIFSIADAGLLLPLDGGVMVSRTDLLAPL